MIFQQADSTAAAGAAVRQDTAHAGQPAGRVPKPYEVLQKLAPTRWACRDRTNG